MSDDLLLQPETDGPKMQGTWKSSESCSEDKLCALWQSCQHLSDLVNIFLVATGRKKNQDVIKIKQTKKPQNKHVQKVSEPTIH